MKKILIISAVVLLFPCFAFAADTGQGSNQLTGDDTGTLKAQAPNDTTNAIKPIDTNLKILTTNTDGKVGLLVTAKRAKTSRLLGLVKLTMAENGSAKAVSVTLNDPPKPNGQKVFEATPGKYKISASRTGYKSITDKEIEIKKGSDNKLSIELEAESSTPDPEQEYKIKLLALLAARLTGQTQYYPGYNPTVSQNGYVLNNDQTAIIPVVVKIQLNGLINANLSTNVAIVDSQTNNSVTLASSASTIGYNLVYRSGCLRPNSQYILRVSTNQILANMLPYQDFPFVTAGIGSYTDITVQPPTSIAYGGSSLANTQVQNILLTSRPADLPIMNCPSSYNPVTQTGNWPTNGTTIWGNQTVSATDFSNYKVVLDNTKTTYYLQSNINPLNDYRKITFVENKAGTGGLAFVPAESGNTTSSQYYATTYTRSASTSSGVQVNINLTKFSRVNFTPSEYASAVSSKTIENFNP